MTFKNKEIYAEILEANVAELPYFRGFLRAVEGRYYQSIDLPEPVLDMGAGDGHFAARTFQNKLKVGLDPAFVSLKEAHHFRAYELLVNSLGDRIPFEAESFASVISNSVLEHIPDVDAVLMDIQRVLKPGGKLVITVPNDNFTQNLSIARFCDHIGGKDLAAWYRKLFNKISRHYHPDAPAQWRGRLEKAGFKVLDEWNYFPPESLKILEWGHYFGLPNWINKKVLGKWVLFPQFGYNHLIYKWLLRHYSKDQKAPDGAYSFFIAQKR
jgi:SAM-dependent methyltransferase